VRIAAIGAGSWGTALAQVLGRGGAHDVALWTRHHDVADEMTATRHNPSYLSEITLAPAVVITADLRDALRGAGIVLLTVPTHAMREVVSAAAPHLAPSAVMVSAAKGFEADTGLTMTAVIGDVLGAASRGRVAALSGPNIAIEIARGLPAASVVGGNEQSAGVVRDACSGPTFRVYSTGDCAGIEYAGALKNIIAIAAGACDGMGVGDNGKAAILTRGLAEIARLGVSAGAQVMTFAGLAGVGDCVVTCASPHSRNRQLGEAIARGATLEEALARIRMVVEGVSATRVAARLAAERKVDMPITREVHAVLFEHKNVRVALTDLMRRDPAEELHGFVTGG
jgi:glycerol-3-phosphate dehydrogenase (NAD(P)+)